MDPWFAAIEASALSIWLRESPSLWAFPFVLILHTVGLAFLVGANVAMDVRILGWARGVPIVPLERYFAFAWIGFWVNAFSGVLLLIAYPTKALTNPLFYAKLTFVAIGIVMMQTVRRRIRTGDVTHELAVPPRIRMLATASLMTWAAAIAAGRFLAYTYSRLMVDDLPR